MRTWRVVIFGHEVMRTELQEDADKTIIEAVREMIEDDDPEDEDEDEDEDDNDQSFVAGGRIADELEHLVFTPEDED